MNQETDPFAGITMSLWVINFYVPNVTSLSYQILTIISHHTEDFIYKQYHGFRMERIKLEFLASFLLLLKLAAAFYFKDIGIG